MTIGKSTTPTSIVLLDANEQGQAMVKAAEGDIFFVAVPEAVRACQAFEKTREFGPQFRALLETLRDWARARQDRIATANVTIRDRDILFLVKQRGRAHNPALAGELTDLDLLVANSPEFTLIDLEVLLIPEVSQVAEQAFLASGESVSHAS